MVSLAPDQTSQSYETFGGFSVGTVGVEESPDFPTELRKREMSLSDMLRDSGYDYKKDRTSEAVVLANLSLYEDYIEEFDAPLMPPKKEFRIKLIVKSIERGKPSICDDLEIW
jgi:hypothetical protein